MLGNVTNAQNMKRMIPLLWAVGSVFTSGCISTHVLKEKTRAHVEYNVDRGELEEVNGKPGYYALLPLTVTGDVATSPFQLGYLMFSHDSHWGSANIRGVLIPLP